MVFSDLGQHIRDQVKIAFAKGDATNQSDLERCNRYYMSLKKLSSNYYGQNYKRTLFSTASGLKKEECNLALTPDMLKYFNEEDKNLARRYYNKLKNIVVKDVKN